jgi:hypothetical protein
VHRPESRQHFFLYTALAGIAGHEKSGSNVDENNVAALVEKTGELSNFLVEELRLFEVLA